MSTNYYVEAKPPCSCCGRPYEQTHIGKSSAGWAFALHIYPHLGINTLEDWKQFWADKKIVDEYGEVIEPHAMLSIITERKRSKLGKPILEGRDWDEFCWANQCVIDHDLNLLRAKIGRYCVAHGEGSYDLMLDEFS